MHQHDAVLNDISACTIELSDGSPCGRPSAREMPFPICGRHAAQLYRYLIKLMGDFDSQPLARMQMWVDTIEDLQAAAAAKAAKRSYVVYYLQVGDLIKVGYTAHLRQRMASYPPTRTLLATEPGGEQVERQRHFQFAELLRHGNEWFSPGAALVDHINALRIEAGEQPVTVCV
jgi:hypothetical protein